MSRTQKHPTGQREGDHDDDRTHKRAPTILKELRHTPRVAAEVSRVSVY
jgi:hypothetical protein